jgi:hypothetical protein
MLRLHFNGVWRKVVIDDLLPAHAGRLDHDLYFEVLQVDRYHWCSSRQA